MASPTATPGPQTRVNRRAIALVSISLAVAGFVAYLR